MNTIQITLPSAMKNTLQILKNQLGVNSENEVVELAINKLAEKDTSIDELMTLAQETFEINNPKQDRYSPEDVKPLGI